MLQYRNTKDEDLGLICTFPKNEKEVFFISSKLSFPLGITQFKEYIKPNIEKTTFIVDDTPVGYADFYKYDGDERLYLGNILLSYQYRGAGYGKFIVRSMIDKLEKYNQKEAYLCVSSDNIKPMLLYKDMGFIPYDLEKRLYCDQSMRCVIFMKKPL